MQVSLFTNNLEKENQVHLLIKLQHMILCPKLIFSYFQKLS